MGDALFIEAEPVGQVYRDLLALASEQCESFSLVWRDQLTFGSSAERLESDLKPFLLREERTSKWPGTELLGHMAMVRHYRLNNETLDHLLSAGSLFAWRAPSLPEDLALYKPDGKRWLGSIAHEGGAWIEAGELSSSYIKGRVPGLMV